MLPGSSQDFVSDEFVDYLGDKYRKVYVKARPIENEANISLVRVLSKFFSVPKSKVILKNGGKSKYKIFDVSN